MSLINQLSEAVVGNKSKVESCPFCGAECRLHHLAEGDRVECLTCKYKSPVDIFALRKHNELVRHIAVLEGDNERLKAALLEIKDAKTYGQCAKAIERAREVLADA